MTHLRIFMKSWSINFTFKFIKKFLFGKNLAIWQEFGNLDQDGPPLYLMI